VKAEIFSRVEGLGFKQLMQTFEVGAHPDRGARRSAWRNRHGAALDYAQNACSSARRSSVSRACRQAGEMAVEIMIAPPLTYFAAREKDSGRRCDLEAGMAKLLPRGWPGPMPTMRSDHGGNVSRWNSRSRILCDARILNIFEAPRDSQARSSPAGCSTEPIDVWPGPARAMGEPGAGRQPLIFQTFDPKQYATAAFVLDIVFSSGGRHVRIIDSAG